MRNIANDSLSPLRCLIVDDEDGAIEGIVDYAEKLDYLEIVGSCSSGIEAMEVLKNQDIDLMFLDINMPRLSGLELLESLEKAPLTILTTAYSEYALDGYRLHVVDYLLKPYSFQRFLQATQKALDILFIEAMQNYLKLYFKEKFFIIHQTMVSLEDVLPKDKFYRVHNSFLVNVSQIELISGGRIFINSHEIPISKHRKEQFLNSVVYKNLISK